MSKHRVHGYVRIANGREQWDRLVTVERHRHDQAYAAIVLAGGYEECGSSGRFRVGPGDVLFHDAFDAHLDRFNSTGAQVLNIGLGACPAARAGRVNDVDALVRLAMVDVEAARTHLFDRFVETRPLVHDWPDMLAADLADDPRLRLESWALRHGLTAESLSRGFGKLYGISPAAFRFEARALCALKYILRSNAPFVEIALRSGHADQPHMTRSVKALTGVSPRHWRASISFKTAGAGRA